MTFAFTIQKRRFYRDVVCLFYNVSSSKPTRTRTQNIEKQRNSLIGKNCEVKNCHIFQKEVCRMFSVTLIIDSVR
jgi:hypothetical protein